ncbi:Outer membrane protein TolC [Thermophagus xiamenensis]|uniref:Outer membrane protein TolC n=2 Tax=Thermophagus xiamenensis TaxID=385682 RepID=A0A1I1VX36_9BACT|nr:Outer membrane protein TolC [Thermophagus xiamenensis]
MKNKIDRIITTIKSLITRNYYNTPTCMELKFATRILTSGFWPLASIPRLIVIYAFTITIAGADLQAQPLDSLFLLAAKNNPELQARYKAFEAAVQRIPQVKGLPDPTLSLGYFLSPVETRLGPQEFKISLSQMLPWFGTLKAKEQAASLAAEARFRDFMDARNRLYYEVAEAYYALGRLRTWTQIEKENINLLKSWKELTTRNYENGVGDMVDVLRVDLLLKESATNLEILNREEKPRLSRLNQLLNRPLQEPVMTDTLEMVNHAVMPLNKDSLLLHHPALQKLDLMEQSSKAEEVVARKNGYPKSGIGIDYVVVGKPSNMQLDNEGKDIIMPMVSLSLPIYRKKYKAAIREAQLNREAIALQKEAAINNLLSLYEEVLYTIQKQEQLILLYDEQIRESSRALNLLTTDYANSGKDFDEILSMQQKLLQYEKNKTEAISRYNTALARLRYVLGR